MRGVVQWREHRVDRQRAGQEHERVRDGAAQVSDGPEEDDAVARREDGKLLPGPAWRCCECAEARFGDDLLEQYAIGRGIFGSDHGRCPERVG